MIKDVKNGLKFLKSTQGFYETIYISIVFLIIGVFYTVTIKDELFMSGSMILAGLNLLYHTSRSTVLNDIVGSSPKRKVYEKYIPNMIAIISVIIAFLFITLITYFNLCNKNSCVKDMIEPYFSFILGSVVTLAFGVIIYKHMIAAIIIYIIGYICSYFYSIYKLPIFMVNSQWEMYIRGFLMFGITTTILLLLEKVYEKHSYSSILLKANK